MNGLAASGQRLPWCRLPTKADTRASLLAPESQARTILGDFFTAIEDPANSRFGYSKTERAHSTQRTAQQFVETD